MESMDMAGLPFAHAPGGSVLDQRDQGFFIDLGASALPYFISMPRAVKLNRLSTSPDCEKGPTVED